MKDKLYKTNHKSVYYHTRNFLISFSLFICCGAVVSIPTYFALSSKQVVKSNAVEETTKIENQKEDRNCYLKY